MKELYISPELEILRFAPVENIATGDDKRFNGSTFDDTNYWEDDEFDNGEDGGL